jgi:hypothetical protein
MEGTKMDALEGAVEEISAEISRLKEQRGAVQTDAERAEERLKELSDRRTVFASTSFSDESGIAQQIAGVMDGLTEALDEESEALYRTKIRAQDAVQKLDQLILKADVEYQAAQKRLAQRRYEELCRERYAHEEDAEEVMAVLIEVLERLEGVYAKQARAAGDAENPSFTHHDPHSTVENWLSRRLRRWLPLESPEKYDMPLPDLDPLSLTPESQRRALGVGAAGALAAADQPEATSTVANVNGHWRADTL